MPEVTLKAEDISCDHCIGTIEKAVTKLSGVRFISGDPGSKEVKIEYDPAAVKIEEIRNAMEEEGYPVEA
ncbi:MAG: heavy-metal-associated domain-containing protein [Dehalococcoidia bacterium]